jgi:APA family basic amino acid/polyamine antiporter
MAPLVDLGAVLGLGSVVLVMLLGQSRVFYAMSRDRLLPAFFGRIHSRFQTPHLAQIAVGVFAGALAGIFPLQVLGELVNIGTLLAFVLVCLGIILLRRARPELPRPFRAPWVPVVPLLGAASCLGLMATLPLDTWLRLFVWMAIGLAIYAVYGRRRGAPSRHERPRSPRATGPTSPRGSLS